MKTLVTAATVEDFIKSKQGKAFSIPENSIITPSARDMANEQGISFVIGIEPPQETPGCPTELIAKIVGEVMLSLGLTSPQLNHQEVDVSGVTVVRGNRVRLANMETQSASNRIKYAELIKTEAMTAGLMTIEEDSLTRTAQGNETIHILEGALDIAIDNRRYQGNPGDLFYIPKKATVVLSSKKFSRSYCTCCY